MTDSPRGFNIRVYGIVEDDGKVLLIRERFQGKLVNKFPGGGLEYGEGIHDCLVREFREELGVKVLDTQLLYINEFFQPSFRDPNEQIIGVYYLVKLNQLPEQTLEDDLQMIWVSKEELENSVDLPIDRAAMSKLIP